jgi:hypothetical protein
MCNLVRTARIIRWRRTKCGDGGSWNEGTGMRTEPSSSRVLMPSERALAVAIGIGMLLLSLASFVATVALYMPLRSLVEGLSK